MSITNNNFSSTPSDISKFYSNGRIPDCELKSAPGLPGSVKIHPQAAEQLGKLFAAARAAGFPFTIISAYRSYERQLDLVGGDPNAKIRGVARAGTSKHGWGTAIDIGELWNAAVATSEKFQRENRAGEKGTNGWDKFDGAVHVEVRNTNRLYQWLDANAPRYGWVNPDWARDGGNYDECWHWEYKVFSPQWPAVLPQSVTNRPVTGAVTSPCGTNTALTSYPARTPIGSSPPNAPDPRDPNNPNSSISPHIASLDSFHPNIQYELTRRRVSVETANVYMPFIKLTSLTRVYSKNLPSGAPVTNDTVLNEPIGGFAPSLGPHGQDYIDFNEMYYPTDNRSIVGFAMTEDPVKKDTEFAETTVRVPLLVTQGDADGLDQRNIPMPGITEATIERGTAGPMGVRGGLTKMDFKITAYSVGQLNTLITYFLRPATRVVVELGRKSSNPNEEITPYNWKKSQNTISTDFTELLYNPKHQKEFINNYVYNNYGRYEIFAGYVVKFDVKYNKNNIYEISLTVHSVQQFEIPTIHTGVKATCPDATDKCRAMDIREYFDEAYSWKPNTFSQLMADVGRTATPASTTTPTNAANVDNWSDHFIAINNAAPGDTSAGAGTGETEYFVSWRFFVEKILNDNALGILSIIPDTNRELLQLGLLRSVQTTATEIRAICNSSLLAANEVGYHPALRSTDANTMIIYNKAAQDRRTEDEKQSYVNLIDAAAQDEDTRRTYDSSGLTNFITGSSVGSFSSMVCGKNSNLPDSSFLQAGVWLNTKAIKQAFASADTVTKAINSLLGMMNAATQGYWNLQLYSADREHSGLFVVDMGLSKRLEKRTTNTSGGTFPWIDEEQQSSIFNSIQDVNIDRYKTADDKPKYIYMFNRGTKRLSDGELGSDLIDLNVEFNLPQVIAVQAIAGVGGPAQKSTLQSINIGELNGDGPNRPGLSLIPNLFATCNNNNICKEEDCGRGDQITQLLAAATQAEEAVKSREAQRPVEPNAEAFGTDMAAYGAAYTAYSDKLTEYEKGLNEAKAKATSDRDAYNQARVQRGFGNTMVISVAQELSSLGTALTLVEFNVSGMLKKLNIDSANAENQPAPRLVPPAHAFNSSNLTKTLVNVTLSGIGGIELFQSFVVDRAPSILKRGFYVVTKVTHKFSVSAGWTTTVEGRFRFRPVQEDSSVGEDVDPCAGVERTSAPTAPTTPAAGTQPTTRGGSGRAAPARQPASTVAAPALNITGYTELIKQYDNSFLRTRFLALEEVVEEPKIFFGLVRGTSATREAWAARVASGQVGRDRSAFEQIKAEIRRRDAESLRAGRGGIREFFGISGGRLAPRQWSQSSGTF